MKSFSVNLKKIGYTLKFIPVYAIKLIQANWDTAKRSLSTNMRINPKIVKVKTELKSDLGLSALSNCISLSPGTTTLDVIEENGDCYLYVHYINATSRNEKEVSEKIKGTIERCIGKVLK